MIFVWFYTALKLNISFLPDLPYLLYVIAMALILAFQEYRHGDV